MTEGDDSEDYPECYCEMCWPAKCPTCNSYSYEDGYCWHCGELNEIIN